MGSPENGNFPLFYVVKMSLRKWAGGSKNPQTPLHNIKMAPKGVLGFCEQPTYPFVLT